MAKQKPKKTTKKKSTTKNKLLGGGSPVTNSKPRKRSRKEGMMIETVYKAGPGKKTKGGYVTYPPGKGPIPVKERQRGSKKWTKIKPPKKKK